MNQIENPAYTYEEIRNAAIDILAGKIKSNSYQFGSFKFDVGAFLTKKKTGFIPGPFGDAMSNADNDIFLEYSGIYSEKES
jgi:hypothetical protein